MVKQLLDANRFELPLQYGVDPYIPLAVFFRAITLDIGGDKAPKCTVFISRSLPEHFDVDQET